MPPRPLKLLITVIDLAGGVGMYCRYLATGLRRFFPNDYDITLLLLRQGTTHDSDAEIFHSVRTLDTAVHGDWRRLLEALPNALRLRRAIREIDPDLIVTAGTMPNLLVPRIAGDRRIVHTVHSHLSITGSRTAMRHILKPALRRTFARDLVVVPSEGILKDLRQNFRATNARLIYHGVDDEGIRIKSTAPAELPTDQPYFAAAGRFTYQKDYPTLLRAFAQARSNGLSGHLVLLGDGPDLGAMRKLARQLDIESVVHFLGYRDNPYPYMARARAFVLSSVWEAFGLVVAEALTLRLPVISTDCPSGPAEILGNGEYGILVPVGQQAALAEVMIKLAGSAQLRARLSAKAAARAEQFTLEKMTRQYHDLFMGMMG